MRDNRRPPRTTRPQGETEATPRPTGDRLQKVIAEAGIASRRAAEELIREGRVRVDGAVVTELGTRVGRGAKIEVDGQPISGPKDKLYIVLNKPPGFVTTVSDPEGRPTVMDLIQGLPRLYPVGRLDYGSEGLVLLTNDGEMTHHLLHPRYEHEREYHALVEGKVGRGTREILATGVMIDDRLTSPANVDILETRKDGFTLVGITLREGRNRQVRRMCEEVGLRVVQLIRVRMGNIVLGDLPVGRWRYLRSSEISTLRRAVFGSEKARTRHALLARGQRALPTQRPERSERPQSDRSESDSPQS